MRIVKYFVLISCFLLGLINLPFALEGHLFNWIAMVGCWLIGGAGFWVISRIESA